MEIKALNMKDTSSGFTTNRVFQLSSQAVMEGFEEGALLLQLNDRHLFELNPTAYYILKQTDGLRTVSQVARGLIEEYQISEAEALQDVLSLYAQFSARGVIEAIEPDNKKIRAVEETPDASPRYIRNPDVVLHEEDPEVGLLINRDTNHMRALNNTGKFIWQQCDGTRSLAEITTAVQEAYTEVPEKKVTQDVQEFVKGMVESGFIGMSEFIEGGN